VCGFVRIGLIVCLSVGYEDAWLILGANLDAPDPWFVVRYYGSNAA